MQNLFVTNDDLQTVLGCNITSVVVLKRFLFADIPTGRIPGSRFKGMEVFALCSRLKDRLGDNWNIEHSAQLVALAKNRMGVA